MEAWQASDLSLRLTAALVGLGLALGIERLRPYRHWLSGGPRREVRHLALWATGAGVLALLPFATAIGAAEAAGRSGTGLLNQLDVPAPLSILVTLLVLDAWTYLLHRLYHRVPALWRLHRVHHSDPSLSATTGVRFHPGEVLLSALSRIPLVFLLGASVAGIAIFEIALLVASQLQHANVCLPERWAKRLQTLIITPNLHRVHHSVQRREADSNFGTILVAWDQAFGSLRRVEPDRVVVGSPDETPEPGDASLGRLLRMPFLRARAGSAG